MEEEIVSRIPAKVDGTNGSTGDRQHIRIGTAPEIDPPGDASADGEHIHATIAAKINRANGARGSQVQHIRIRTAPEIDPSTDATADGQNVHPAITVEVD